MLIKRPSFQSPAEVPPEPAVIVKESSPVVVEAPKIKSSPRIVTIKKDAHPHLFKPGYSITGRSLSKQFKEELK